MKKSLILALVLLPVLLLFSACGGSDLINTYTLSITVQGSGSVIPNNNTYPSNTLAYIDVQPANGWSFNRWEGINRYEVSSNAGRWQILMTGNKSLVAVFTQQGDPGDPGNDTYHNLNVTVQGRGSVSPNSGSFKKNEVVELIVRPENGWAFSRWTGTNANDVFTGSGSYYICIDGNKSLTAVFEQSNRYLNIEITGKGKVDERQMSSEYGHGSVVRLTAKPDSGWLFKEWQGDVRGNATIVDIEMNEDKYIKAIFEREPERFTLTIKKIGQGKVTEELLSDYVDGSLVELKATPSSGWLFVEWRGDEKGKKPSIIIEMDSDKTITAVFAEDVEYYFLDVSVEGNGRVTKSPDEVEYAEGEEVTLKAVADSGWEFKEWRGDASGSNPQVKVTMNKDKTVKAVFVKEGNRYTLNVNINGSGTVNKSPDQSEYEEGTVVTLTASPSNNFEFTGWSGDASGSNSSVQVTMNSNKNVTANFKEKSQGYTVSVRAGNQGGNPYKEPNKEIYQEGEEVTAWGGPSYGYQVAYFTANGQPYYNYEGGTIESISQNWEFVFYYQASGGGGPSP